MASKMRESGAQFVRYFGSLLEALRSLGGSANRAEGDEDDEALEILGRADRGTFPYRCAAGTAARLAINGCDY